MQNKFKKGDRVQFLDEVGEATVLEVLGVDKVFIEDSHGFEFDVHPDRLIIVPSAEEVERKYDQRTPNYEEIIEKNVSESSIKKATKNFEAKYNEEPVARMDGIVEVDLHIHELLDSESGLGNSEKLKIQMDHFERMMNRAEVQKIKRLVFIHGIGHGVLRNEIRTHLKTFYPHVTIMDGEYREYGYGATEVRF